MSAVDEVKLREGDLCEFTYIKESGNFRWYRWNCTAIFLERVKNEYQDQLVISLRPLAGTSFLESQHVENITVLREREDRMGGRGDAAVRLPWRMPGAVQAPRVQA